MRSEEELLHLIRLADLELAEHRAKVNQFRKLMLDAETEMIGSKLYKSKLEEELRIIRTEKIE